MVAVFAGLLTKAPERAGRSSCCGGGARRRGWPRAAGWRAGVGGDQHFAGGNVAVMRLLEDMPRFPVPHRQGEVGKTSVACATAVRLAEGPARATGVHRPGVERGPGVRPGDRQPDHPAGRGARVGCVGDRSGTRPRVSPAGTRAPVKDFLSAKDLASATGELSGSCTTEIASPTSSPHCSPTTVLEPTTTMSCSTQPHRQYGSPAPGCPGSGRSSCPGIG